MILERFQEIFNKEVLPYIKENLERNKYTDPIFYTLETGRNRFRACTALIAAKMSGISYKEALSIAAVGELIHTAIIIEDDIADNALLRRGKISAWKKFGISHSLFSSTYIIPICIRFFDKITSKYKHNISLEFLESYKKVSQGQILQENLSITDKIDYNTFKKIHIYKTSIGIWAIKAASMVNGNLKNATMFEKYAIKLGEAGSIKNDIESLLSTKDNYEPCVIDLREGILTYPIYLYYQRCNKEEKREFLSIFGNRQSTNWAKLKKKFINKSIIAECGLISNNCIKKAIGCLDKAPYSKEKDMLIKWAEHHRLASKTHHNDEGNKSEIPTLKKFENEDNKKSGKKW